MNKIEEDYRTTHEPWLAQAGLLNQIGLQFSRDLRLTESAQSIRSLIASVCRKVNCFNEIGPRIDGIDPRQPYAEAWRLWSRKESMCRLAYSVWVSMNHFMHPPSLPIVKAYDFCDFFFFVLSPLSKLTNESRYQLLDSQNALFFDLPPIIPTDLLRLPLPGTEELWQAPTAAAWLEALQKQGKDGES